MNKTTANGILWDKAKSYVIQSTETKKIGYKKVTELHICNSAIQSHFRTVQLISVFWIEDFHPVLF